MDSKNNNNKTTKTPRKRKTNYLNNKDFLAEVIKSKENDEITPKLARMFQLLTAKYGKHPWYSGYTYNEDMQGYALLMLVKTWRAFKPEKSSNPFAFFTQCVKNSFKQYKLYEKKQQDVRDKLLVNQGMLPSFNYQAEQKEKEEQDKLNNENKN